MIRVHWFKLFGSLQNTIMYHPTQSLQCYVGEPCQDGLVVNMYASHAEGRGFAPRLHPPLAGPRNIRNEALPHIA